MEQWKKIAGFEGAYRVSDEGRVMSIAREWTWGKGAIRKQGDRVLSAGLNSAGYLSVNLVVDGVSKNKIVHRLVANAFIPNPESKKEVNHLNGNKLDNRATNLAWNTRQENQQHAYDTGLHRRTRQVCADSCRRRFSKPVIQMTRAGEVVREWPSQHEAARVLGLAQANINSCIHGRAKSSGGFIWKRA